MVCTNDDECRWPSTKKDDKLASYQEYDGRKKIEVTYVGVIGKLALKAFKADAIGVSDGTSRSERVSERNSGPKIIAITKTTSHNRQKYRLYFNSSGK